MYVLLYGRHIRGPLAVLKEEWEEPSTCQNSVLSHLLDTREKMKTMAELANLFEHHYPYPFLPFHAIPLAC
jgi:hypothetical protein